MNSSSTPVVVIGAGQSGLAAARAIRDAGFVPLVLEASHRAAGSWPDYYDSLTAFSPVRFSGISGFPMRGNKNAYPTRDDVVSYLDTFAESLEVDIRTSTPVESVTAESDGFIVQTSGGQAFEARGVVAASGSFSNPYLPSLPGQDSFTRRVVHAADYRRAEPFTGQRVVVVGAGNSAVQIAVELAGVADVSLASRQPLLLVPQLMAGRDVHRFITAGFDWVPGWAVPYLTRRTPVIDSGQYREAFARGVPDRREMFTGFDGDTVVWPNSEREPTDMVLFATGYRPSLRYLNAMGALDEVGMPRHRRGVSTTHDGLVYVGLEFQRTFASNTLRGVAADADYVVARLRAHLSGIRRRVR